MMKIFILILLSFNLYADYDVYEEYLETISPKFKLIENKDQAIKHVMFMVKLINSYEKKDQYIPQDWLDKPDWNRHYYNLQTNKWRHLILATILPLEMYVRNETLRQSKSKINQSMDSFYKNLVVENPNQGTGEHFESRLSSYLKKRLIYTCMNIEIKHWGASNYNMSEEIEQIALHVEQNLEVYGW